MANVEKQQAQNVYIYKKNIHKAQNKLGCKIDKRQTTTNKPEQPANQQNKLNTLVQQFSVRQNEWLKKRTRSPDDSRPSRSPFIHPLSRPLRPSARDPAISDGHYC